MAETLISPGVLARENDQSLVTAQPLTRGAAIIGPTVKGPVEKPTLVSSYSSFQTIFGSTLESGSQDYTYLTSIAANNYFQQGGTSLLVTRVTSGSFDPALSTTRTRSVSNSESLCLEIPHGKIAVSDSASMHATAIVSIFFSPSDIALTTATSSAQTEAG